MSDNPAHSLRRELEAAIDGARLHVFWPTSMPKAAVDATWPLIRAALEAARADERERLQQENQQLRERLEAIRRDPTLALVTNVKPLKVVFEDDD